MGRKQSKYDGWPDQPEKFIKALRHGGADPLPVFSENGVKKTVWVIYRNELLKEMATDLFYTSRPLLELWPKVTDGDVATTEVEMSVGGGPRIASNIAKARGRFADEGIVFLEKKKDHQGNYSLVVKRL